MTALLLTTTDLTDAADAWRLGIPQRVGTQSSEDTRPALARFRDEVPVAYFPRRVMSPGFKLIRDRIMRLGGSFGVPRGPELDHNRTRVPDRRPTSGPGVSANAVMSAPAGLTPTSPWWESHLYGSAGYLAP